MDKRTKWIRTETKHSTFQPPRLAFDLEIDGKKIWRSTPPRQQDAVNKTGRYTVTQVWMRDEGTNDPLLPYLMVIDMKKMKLVNTIQLGEPGEIRGMTYVDVH